MYDIYKTELLVSGFLLVFMLVTLFLSMHALGYLPSTSFLTQNKWTKTLSKC